MTDYIVQIKNKKERDNKPFPLHKYLHHDLTSQAFMFNLIGPIVIEKRFYVLEEVLKETGINLEGEITSINFELEDRKVFKENQGQSTSIDVVIDTDTEDIFYLEFKFTESEFGGCSLFSNGDCDGRNPANNFEMCYLHCIGRLYWLLMKKHSLITPTLAADSRCPFTDLYQAYRILMFVLEKKRSIYSDT